jgi:hypothetical protein
VSDCLTRLLAPAARLEGEGQYNVAKLARAAAEALACRAAYWLELPPGKDALASEIDRAVAGLPSHETDEDLLAALKRGAAAMRKGRLPLIHETPHPYVRRTCGQVALGEPAEKCPPCGAWPPTFKRFLPVYWLDALEPFAVLERCARRRRTLQRCWKGCRRRFSIGNRKTAAGPFGTFCHTYGMRRGCSAAGGGGDGQGDCRRAIYQSQHHQNAHAAFWPNCTLRAATRQPPTPCGGADPPARPGECATGEVVPQCRRTSSSDEKSGQKITLFSFLICVKND